MATRMAGAPMIRGGDSSLGKLPGSPLEVRLAATLFLLLLGVADLFGAWQVKNFSSFTPAGVKETVGPDEHHAMGMSGRPMTGHAMSSADEKEIDLASLDRPRHHIGAELLVQDTHVHVPVYALTAAALSLLAFGLVLPSRVRSLIVVLAFAAPAANFIGLWGAHLFHRAGSLFGLLAVAGGFAMGLAYLIILAATLAQCWFARPAPPPAGPQEAPLDA
jgi:hypothetical protein